MISAQTRSAFVARENRFPLFRIMLYSLFEHDLFGKPVPLFRIML